MAVIPAMASSVSPTIAFQKLLDALKKPKVKSGRTSEKVKEIYETGAPHISLRGKQEGAEVTMREHDEFGC